MHAPTERDGQAIRDALNAVFGKKEAGKIAQIVERAIETELTEIKWTGHTERYEKVHPQYSKAIALFAQAHHNGK